MHRRSLALVEFTVCLILSVLVICVERLCEHCEVCKQSVNLGLLKVKVQYVANSCHTVWHCMLLMRQLLTLVAEQTTLLSLSVNADQVHMGHIMAEVLKALAIALVAGIAAVTATGRNLLLVSTLKTAAVLL